MRYRRHNPWVIALLVLVAGLLVTGLSLAVIATRDSEPPEQPDVPALHLEDLRLAEPLDLQAFWREQGFIPVERNLEELARRDWAAGQWVHWTQRVTDWHLVPYRPDSNYQDALGKLVTRLATGGLTLQMDQRGQRMYVSLFESIPMVQQRMELEIWSFQRQTPALYDPEFDGGRLAIVIDDWGYTSSAMEPLFQFPYPLTLAVLPHLPQSEIAVVQGNAFAHEVILHQPMEAQNPDADPGPGAIYVGMSQEEIERELKNSLTSLGQVVGVNNHMGSRVTSDETTMLHVLNYLKDEGYYFLDSMTSQDSIVAEVAERVGIPYAVNQIFLDNINETDVVMEQIRRALRRTENELGVIAIGHVRPRTADALWAMIPELVEAGIELVPVSALLTVPDSAQ